MTNTNSECGSRCSARPSIPGDTPSSIHEGFEELNRSAKNILMPVTSCSTSYSSISTHPSFTSLKSLEDRIIGGDDIDNSNKYNDHGKISMDLSCDGTNSDSNKKKSHENDPIKKYEDYTTCMNTYKLDKSAFFRNNNFNMNYEAINEKLAHTTLQKDLKLNANIGTRKRIKKYSDFKFVSKLGQGTYGIVELVLNNATEELIILKKIIKERILVDTWVRHRKFGYIPSEIYIMLKLNDLPNDNIPSLLDFFEDDDYFYIEMPIHGGTSHGCIELFDFIEYNPILTDLEARLIFKQVANAMKHLHDLNIVHRDIKDENVMIDSDGYVQLIDLGSAAEIKKLNQFDTFVGTLEYSPPEVLHGERYNGKPQDIWSLGVLLYTIVYKENPFYNIDEIIKREIDFNKRQDVHPDCIDLIKWILTSPLEERPTIDDVLNHIWLND